MEHKKIKVTLTRVLIREIEKNMTATDTFSSRVCHLLLFGINFEGLELKDE